MACDDRYRDIVLVATSNPRMSCNSGPVYSDPTYSDPTYSDPTCSPPRVAVPAGGYLPTQYVALIRKTLSGRSPNSER